MRCNAVDHDVVAIEPIEYPAENLCNEGTGHAQVANFDSVSTVELIGEPWCREERSDAA